MQMSLRNSCDVSFVVAEALLNDKEAGAFLVRDSTSFRGSFGLAMKVDQTAVNSGKGFGSDAAVPYGSFQCVFIKVVGVFGSVQEKER